MAGADERFSELMELCGFAEPPDARGAAGDRLVEVERVADSCGYGVPLMKQEG